MKWYCVKTNPRCEERAAAAIVAAGFEAFLPMMKKEFRHHRSKRWMSRRYPVFVGYLFVGISDDLAGQFGKVRKCDGVKDFLGKRAWGEDVIDIPQAVVTSVMAAVASGSFDELRPFAERVKKGDRVKIDLGALAGQVGVVDAVGRERAEVMTQMFGGRLASVPIDSLRSAA